MNDNLKMLLPVCIMAALLSGCASSGGSPEAQERDLRGYAFVVCVNSVYKELHSQSQVVTSLLDEEEQVLIKRGGLNPEMALRIAARSREFAASTPVSTAMRACLYWKDSEDLTHEIAAFRR